jgi:hypothetical protein
MVTGERIVVKSVIELSSMNKVELSIVEISQMAMTKHGTGMILYWWVTRW